MSGKRPFEDRTPYATSKTGAIGFTRTLAVELAGDGVIVDAVLWLRSERADRVTGQELNVTAGTVMY